MDTGYPVLQNAGWAKALLRRAHQIVEVGLRGQVGTLRFAHPTRSFGVTFLLALDTGRGLMETTMFIVERRNSVPRWYYIVFFIAMLATGYFGVLLTMHIRWRPKARKSM